MLAKSSVQNPKTLVFRSGQKLPSCPNPCKAKASLLILTVTKQFGRLSWQSSGSQQQPARAQGVSWVRLRCPMVRWTLPSKEGDFTVWMPDRGVTPKNSLQGKRSQRETDAIDVTQNREGPKCRSSRNLNVSAIKSQEWHRATSSGLCT